MRYICHECGAGGASGSRGDGPATYHCHECGGQSTMVPELHLPVYRKAKIADELAVALQCALDQAAADELDGWYANAMVVLDKYNNQGETP